MALVMVHRLFKPRCLEKAFGIICSLAVIGCTAPDNLKDAPSSRFIQTQPDARAVVKKPVEKPSQTAVSTKTAPVEPAREFPEPTILTDLSADKVTSLLGAPGFKRMDDPAEIWQYKAENCIMDLYLYDSLDHLGRSVAHYEIRLQPGKNITAKSCFASVIRAADPPVEAS